MKRIPTFAAILLGFSLFIPEPVDAAKSRFSFIRDAEIENTIRVFATPLFRAAGLEPSAVQIYLVKDKSLNAFVAGGQKLFLNTGLLMRSENPGQVIGVIAHETGHISGGHLSRVHGALEQSTAQSILALVLGGAAAIATGRGDIGQAIALGGQQVGLRSFLQYSRTQEAAADQAAMKILEATGQSARGLLEFFDILGDQELLSVKRQDPYVRTHPLSRERVNAVRAHVDQSPFGDREWSPAYHMAQARIRAKLRSFLDPFGHTMRRYPTKDTSLPARYARAIAYFRKPDLENGLTRIDALIDEHPRDPYFLEVKAQFLFESGRAAEALPVYQAATDLAPHDSLIRRALAQVQLELDDPALLEPAAKNLRMVLRDEADSPFTWRLLAIAYGRNGQIAESSLALAEEAVLKGEKAAATHHAGRAEKLLPRGSSGWLKAQDILHATKKKDE